MKTNRDAQSDDALVKAMLCDEEWQTGNIALKAEALRAFTCACRVRRIRRWAAGAATAVATAGLLYFSHGLFRTSGSPRLALLPPPSSSRSPVQAARTLSDQELVAAFPKGSCFIAEIDGEKQLVFVNPQLESLYVSHAADQKN